MRKFTTRDLTLAAVLAAVYAALTITLPVPQYGAVQIRFAEALTVLPFLFPAATPGLFVGCIIANLFSPFVLDVVFGSMATLLACLWTSRMTSRWLAPLPPVLCNAVIVGAEIAWAETGITPAFWTAFGFNAVTVGLGELIACYALGSLLLSAMPQVPYFRGMIPAMMGTWIPALSTASIKRLRLSRSKMPWVWMYLAPASTFWRSLLICRIWGS